MTSSSDFALLDDMYDACTQFTGHAVTFPTNAKSDCISSSDPDCGTDGFCKPCANLADSHDSCYGFTIAPFTKDAHGTMITSFSATVDAAPEGCCQANSCVGTYFESQVAAGLAGDRIYFDYQAIAGDDWFEVAVGLYDDSSNLKNCKVFRGNAMDDYYTEHFEVPSQGNYKLASSRVLTIGQVERHLAPGSASKSSK